MNTNPDPAGTGQPAPGSRAPKPGDKSRRVKTRGDRIRADLEGSQGNGFGHARGSKKGTNPLNDPMLRACTSSTTLPERQTAR